MKNPASRFLLHVLGAAAEFERSLIRERTRAGQLRYKQDAVPGRDIPIWFKVTKPGKYEIPCAELCGFGHSGMRGWLYVHPQAEYDAWARENHAAPVGAAAGQGS